MQRAVHRRVVVEVEGWYWFLFLPSVSQINDGIAVQPSLPPSPASLSDQAGQAQWSYNAYHFISFHLLASQPASARDCKLFFLWLVSWSHWASHFPKNINLEPGIRTWSHVTISYCHDGVLTFYQIKRGSSASMISRKWNYDISKIVNQSAWDINKKEGADLMIVWVWVSLDAPPPSPPSREKFKIK